VDDGKSTFNYNLLLPPDDSKREKVQVTPGIFFSDLYLGDMGHMKVVEELLP